MHIMSAFMASISLFSLIFVLSFHLSLARNASDVSEQTDLRTYIVHLQAPDHQNFSDRESWYTSLLPATKANANKKSRITHFYHHVFPGFAAKLTPEEVESLKKTKGFVSAWPEKVNYLHTTHSPAFLGLQPNVGFWRDSNYGQGIIIGVLDTGIRPDHPSFGDAGMPLPPKKWKGSCESISCNRKLIGARSFDGSRTPQDRNGHGTHVTGTAAGNFVPGANVYGNANGTAVGVAPRAHVAMYKVCPGLCPDSYIMAGIDAAIGDGVDVLSMSIGSPSSRPFYEDPIARGGFSAMKRGIFVSVSAGNAGPSPRTIGNEAPWLLTGGASSIDRKLIATVVLGNNRKFDGESLFQPKNFPPSQFPLVYPGLSNNQAQFCNSSSLANYKVSGKIVFCKTGRTHGVDVAQNVRKFGGKGMILMNDETNAYTIQTANIPVLPVSQVSSTVGQQIISYIRTSTKPTAALEFKGTIIGDVHAPAVASFSSRGPSVQSPGILKPDIIGPGINILAAWPFSVEGNPGAQSTFNIISGTSMACPHLSGVAALLKKAHPNWSPAAIKSAIMTTAYQTNLGKNPIEDQTYTPTSVFALGAGHVDPSRVTNPGLIYDIHPNDYIPYLCGLGYTNQQVSGIVLSSVDCSQIRTIQEAQLNYPSFSVKLGKSASSSQTYTRTVTNVGGANINYSAQVVAPPGVVVVVSPSSLSFSRQNQKMTYRVTFTRITGAPTGTFQGSITWRSNRHLVRSPIAAVLI